MLFTHRTAGGRCPCGAENAACGPPSDVVPVDERIEEVAAVGGPLKKYRVTSPTGVETVMKLNTTDAEARGLGEDDLADAEPEEKAAEPAANKARSASANKGRGARGGD